MAGEVTLDAGTLKVRLDRLLALHEDVSVLRDALHLIQARQDKGTWSARGTTFAGAYRGSLDEATANVAELLAQLASYRDALTASADRLVLTDTQVQDRLARLAAREAGIDSPMPTTTTPWDGRGSGTYTYDPTTRTGHDDGTDTTQVAPAASTTTTRLRRPSRFRRRRRQPGRRDPGSDEADDHDAPPRFIDGPRCSPTRGAARPSSGARGGRDRGDGPGRACARGCG